MASLREQIQTDRMLASPGRQQAGDEQHAQLRVDRDGGRPRGTAAGE